jgi:GrpB-like predicted nucleotidyltransferase (UPF0157 family)
MASLRIETYPALPAECLPWDPRAPLVAAAIARSITAQRPSLAVEHIGSTAVPGCAGKGVVDLMLLYPPGELEPAKAVLAALGFQPQRSVDPWPESRPMRTAAVRWEGALFLVHVHVIAADDDEVRQLRAFRDRLRSDPAYVAAYVARKRAVLAEGILDPVEYSKAKGSFFTP